MTTRNRTRIAFSIAVVALAVFAGSAQAGPLEGELGILTPGTLAGNNPATGASWAPGDSYRFAFFTSARTTAESADISTYNAWVQGLADATTTYDIGVDEGVTWKAIGSTDAVDAIDNTSTTWTVASPGDPIFLLDGSTVVANDYQDLWDGSIQNIINLTEQGLTSTYWPFTGTYTDGTAAPGHGASYGALGGGSQIHQGKSDSVTEWIWRVWTGDPPSTELNMYALSDPLFIAGGLLTLEVNTVTGSTRLLGDSSQANDINFYEITSEANSLDATNWSSLADQDYEGSGSPDGSGDGWEESGGVGSHALAEGFLQGNTTIGAAASVPLGMGYNPSVGDTNLVFKYRTATGSILEGLVEYVTGGLPGDYNGSGQVEQADLDLVLLNWGAPHDPAPGGWSNDLPTPDKIDQDELDGVLLNWGNTVAVAATGVVPEPASACLLLIGGLLLGRLRRSDGLASAGWTAPLRLTHPGGA